MSSPDFRPSDMYKKIMRRRSTKAREMLGPPLDKTEVEAITAAALRTPDHGKLAPWRLIVLDGAERNRLGQRIGEALIREKETSPEIAKKMEGYATQGPTLIVAVYSPKTTKPIPEWEQMLSSGACCMNMLMAAESLGLAGQWLTGWASYSPHVMAGLGLAPHEKIAGFLFFGRKPAEAATDRPRPDPADHIRWGLR